MKKRALLVLISIVVIMPMLAGCGGGGNTAATPSTSVPTAPTGVTATVGNTQISVSWSAVTGATSYNIYWSTTAGVTKTSGTKIFNATSPYTHTGLTNGTTCYYVVTAVNSSDESVESSQVSATPQQPALMGGSMQGNPLNLTNTVTTFAGTAGVAGSTDGTGAAASFYFPDGITTDGANLYVADSNNSTIRKIVVSTGAVSTLAGSPWPWGSGSTDGTGAAARFNLPKGITTDGTNLYVTDSGNQTIRKIVISTGVVTTVAGSAGISGSTDGTGVAASFYSPDGITTDGANLYVADSSNSTIRKVLISTGAVSTLAGTVGVAGTTIDGTGSAARFCSPAGITTDGANLYVTDPALNHNIRKIVISTGAVSTLAGILGVVGSTDGTGAAASFNSPEGITTDGTNLYVVDSGGNNTIRKIQ